MPWDNPHGYLKQHIHAMEQRYGQKAAKMSFRDPSKKTNTFTFTLYNNAGECFHAQQIKMEIPISLATIVRLFIVKFVIIVILHEISVFPM